MPARSSRRPRYLVAHPGAELYGSDRVMLESVVGFVESGADVVVTLPAPGPLVKHLAAAGAEVEIAPTLVLRKALLRPHNWGALVTSALRGFRAARRMLKEYDVDAVYVSTVTLPLWPIVAATRRIPSVLHLHEGEQGAPRIVKIGMYAPALLTRDIVVNSEFSRGVLRAAFPRLARRAHVVYNGVAAPASFTPAPAVPTRPPRLVYVGRLSPRKGPDLIVEALSELPDRYGQPHLDLVGDVFAGYEWFDAELHERIAALGMTDRVRMLGFQPDVWGAVDAGDLVVVPSRMDEPFGNTAVEGVLAGRPVLVSDTSGLREATAGVSTAIRFAPDDVGALAAAIAQALDGWGNLQPRLENEARAAAERYSPARYRREMADRMRAVTTKR